MDLLLLLPEVSELITQRTHIYKNIDPTCFICHQQVKKLNLIILIFSVNLLLIWKKKIFSNGFIKQVIKSSILTIIIKTNIISYKF